MRRIIVIGLIMFAAYGASCHAANDNLGMSSDIRPKADIHQTEEQFPAPKLQELILDPENGKLTDKKILVPGSSEEVLRSGTDPDGYYEFPTEESEKGNPYVESVNIKAEDSLNAGLHSPDTEYGESEFNEENAIYLDLSNIKKVAEPLSKETKPEKYFSDGGELAVPKAESVEKFTPTESMLDPPGTVRYRDGGSSHSLRNISPMYTFNAK